MHIDRRVAAGVIALVGFVTAATLVSQTLPPQSFARAALWDTAMPLMQVAALVLTCLALRRNAGGPYRWTLVFLALWLFSNLFADVVWAWYELVLRSPVPSPSPADLGYLASYPLAFLTILATWKVSGTQRRAESALDAMMLTLGIGGLGWPLLLAPLLESSPQPVAGLISLAYPLGDLLVIVAFALLLLGSGRRRPPQFLFVIWGAFLIQVVADYLYFMGVVRGNGFVTGGLLDPLWTLVFALAGVAALMPMDATGSSVQASPAGTAINLPGRPLHPAPSYPRMLLPYLAVPVAGALIWVQFARFGAVWDAGMKVLIYAGIGLVALLVLRQFLTLRHNRQLYAGVAELSQELSDQVMRLAGLTSRLEQLNNGAVHLNSLRALSDIVQDGLELACFVTMSPAGWVTLTREDGSEPVTAVFGDPAQVPVLGADHEPEAARRAEEVPLAARGEHIGSLWLVRPAAAGEEPDLVRAVGAQLATAIDNIRRYEEVVRLAEHDPLTGLYNHRGVHQRLALEGRRAQQTGGMLSLVMIDLDDFKLLNDTYGHPVGDRVLTEVSETIRSVLRHTDMAGRVGGDEMMLVLPDTDREGAMQMAKRLREALAAKPFALAQDQTIALRLSLGVATFPTDADTLTGLVGVADAGLYASKQRGGDTITEPGPTDERQVEHPGLHAIAGRLMDVVGARQHYTRRHSDRVAIHALELGRAIGLSDEALDTLKLAALLHDIGEPGRGRNARQHAERGEAIIRDLPRIAEVLETVHAHHERYDGTGHPAGLLGENIPLLARILAVADAYSAMTGDRGYRAKLSPDQAREELLKVAGTRLDPNLVEKFVQTLEKDGKPRFAAAG